MKSQTVPPPIRSFASGLDHPEGLAFDRHGNLWAGGEAGQIYRISPDGKKVVAVAETGGFNLGLAFSPEGWLVICDGRGARLWRLEPDTLKLTVFAATSGGQPLTGMNFPVFDRSGFLYASENGTWGKRNGVVHRFAPHGSGEPWLRGISFANGLALDAAETALYVVQSTKDNVLRVPVRPDSSAGRADVFVEGVGSVPDGLAFDTDGFLYVSCYGDNHIWRVSPRGKKSLFAGDPSSILLNRATNVAFGGSGRRTLFVANLGGWHIAKIKTSFAGQPLAGS